ncbi:hypothetical protein [Paracoccus laeviglucosivorans]|uniref:Uncharacterized protein n=1 Tax=Paracoccus laeviglucosivorans TaxID=1197861 RepID=A0A521CWU1_9RHOB|nr:hypothetical protein [Paracoccus laeviglucosivorans]SMO63914.1 hypothetical protein SAMN06265221_105223 [Paracoccus laeviglucosivorans]
MQIPSHQPKLRSLDHLLSLADGGEYLPDLMDRIEANNVALRQHALDYGSDAKGKITITIDLKINRIGQLEMVVDDKIVEPKSPKRKAHAWMNGSGEITAHNPAQARMDFREPAQSPTILKAAE